MERDRLVYQARLRADYGRAWRRKAPVEARMPLKLARYGVPLRETAAAGPAAALGHEPSARTASAAPGAAPGPALPPGTLPMTGDGIREHESRHAWRTGNRPDGDQPASAAERPNVAARTVPAVEAELADPVEDMAAAQDVETAQGHSAAESSAPSGPSEAPATPAPTPARGQVSVPVGNGRWRSLGGVSRGAAAATEPTPVPDPDLASDPDPGPAPPEAEHQAGRVRRAGRDEQAGEAYDAFAGHDDFEGYDSYYAAYRQYVSERGDFPNARQLSRFLNERFGMTDSDGSLLSEQCLREFTRGCKQRYTAEMGTGV